MSLSKLHCFRKKSGRDNLFKCTYVLPDGITYTKGFVKDMEEACRYRALYDGTPDLLSGKEGRDQSEDTDRVEDRKRIDLTKNEFNLTNERFLVPEMIFRPADLVSMPVVFLKEFFGTFLKIANIRIQNVFTTLLRMYHRRCGCISKGRPTPPPTTTTSSPPRPDHHQMSTTTGRRRKPQFPDSTNPNPSHALPALDSSTQPCRPPIPTTTPWLEPPIDHTASTPSATACQNPNFQKLQTLGMNEAGLAECIVRSVNSCHPLLHPVLYERLSVSIILTGGNTLFPHFAERLEKELRPLVPDDYHLKITAQEDPILGVWRGGSLLASSPDFESMCTTKADYEEQGSERCSRRFFQ
ncbi:hypothetical protein Cgig2_023482 [Carnegiea gigantea]|uniref:Actin-related protein 6 n=1 Tax=Carnegiea gigantea TaxID=171969 RepID=A0A9Q1JVT5_9CARY|nr:hypothetical protein Cgig2_023482 [Carnegiea gigantea]